MTVQEQYRSMLNELLILRAEGRLSDDLESYYVERLDTLWWKLSEAERDECDGVFDGAPSKDS